MQHNFSAFLLLLVSALFWMAMMMVIVEKWKMNVRFLLCDFL